jgi:TolB-like protein/DNA-binding SARP family transcriptional activator/lipoprotein NlpI
VITLRTLGAVKLRGHGGEELDAVLSQPKRLALLYYLVAAGPGFHRRDTLFGLFWMESDQAHARAALNQSVYFLRRQLDREVLLSRGNDEIAVDRSELWCDVLAFEQALGEGNRRGALELYRGELLPGFFLSGAPAWERWLDAERERLRSLATTAAWGLADEALATGDAASAGRWGRRAVDWTPYDEVQLRRLLELLARIGDRTGAMRAYDEAAARVAADDGGELSDTTRSLAERIQAGEVEETVTLVSPGALEIPSRPTTATPGAPPEATRSARRRRGRRLRTAPLLVVALGLGGLVLSALSWIESRPAPDVGDGAPGAITSMADVRLAVLPLKPAGGGSGADAESGSDYLAAAMTDELTRRLSALAGLGVIAPTSVAEYRDVRPLTAEIGRRLGARYLIEGNVETDGDQIRVGVRLVDAGPGDTLWSGRYDAAIADLPAVQGEIAIAAASALSVDIGVAERRRLLDPGTGDPGAHRAYLRGRHFLGKSDEASFRAALEHFRTAVDRDPTYARAWSGMSDAYDHLAGISALDSKDAYPRARAAAERALEIDPDLAEAHASLAMALSHHYWQSDAAERHWRRAFELRPSYARARRTYAGHLRNLGRFDEALAQATLSRELDPIPVSSHLELLIIDYFLRRYEVVITDAENLAAADPGYAYAHFLRALALVQLERWDQALGALHEVDPDRAWSDARLIRAYVDAREGREAAARSELRARERNAGVGADGFSRAIIHLGLGEPEMAMAALEEAYDARVFRLRLIGYEPLFDPLRADPRFQELLELVGLGGIQDPDERAESAGGP